MITDDMEPPAPATAGRHRGVGPWPKHPGHTTPADDMAGLSALTRQLIAQRPDLAHDRPFGPRGEVAPR